MKHIYGRRFIQPLRQLANIYNNIQAALAGAERVFEIIDTQPEMEDAPDADPLESIHGEVRFDHVKFGHMPEVLVIRNMSLKANAGQKFESGPAAIAHHCPRHPCQPAHPHIG